MIWENKDKLKAQETLLKKRKEKRKSDYVLFIRCYLVIQL